MNYYMLSITFSKVLIYSVYKNCVMMMLFESTYIMWYISPQHCPKGTQNVVHIFCLMITSHVIGPNKINNNTGNMNNLPFLNSYHVPDIILNTLHILFHSILTTVHSISYFFHWFTDEETERINTQVTQLAVVEPGSGELKQITHENIFINLDIKGPQIYCSYAKQYVVWGCLIVY